MIVTIILLAGLLIGALTMLRSAVKPPAPKPAEPKPAHADPIDARTLRRYVPKGTQLSDFVIPCPDCGWNTSVSREWMLANSDFICPRCNWTTHLIKSPAGAAGPGAIGDRYDDLKTRNSNRKK